MPETADIVLILEGNSDLRVVRGLAERALLEATPDFVADFFVWRGLESHQPYLLWRDVNVELRQRRMTRLYGKFNGLEGSPYAFRTRHALLLAHHANPLAVVLVCDADNQPERLLGLQQARDSHFADHYPVVVAVANPCREAWLVCGFTPQNNTEKNLLETLHQELSFQPCLQPERLKTADSHVRNAKTVLSRLTSGSLEREHQILELAVFSRLLEHGQNCGLTAFLEEVRSKLAPLLGVRA